MIKQKLKLLGLTLAFLGSASMDIRADDLLQDAGGWMQVLAEGSLKVVDPRLEKGRIWLEGQARFNDNWNHWNQGVVRAALGYSISDRATIWAGYTWVPTQAIGKNFVSEQDVWPAFRYVLPTDIGTFSFRTMFEGNFLKGDEVRYRPRQMLRFSHSLELEPRLSLIAWDEVLLRANSTPFGGKAGFDQNRVFAGLGWNFNKTFRAEAGYLNQYLDDANHIHNSMNHLVLASMFINF